MIQEKRKHKMQSQSQGAMSLNFASSTMAGNGDKLEQGFQPDHQKNKSLNIKGIQKN